MIPLSEEFAVGLTRFFGTLLVFSVVGPLVGTITLAPFLIPIPSLSRLTGAQILGVVSFGYAIGLVPAIAVGMLVGAALAKRGRIHFFAQLIVGIVVGLGFAFFSALTLDANENDGPSNLKASYLFYAMWIVPCVISTFFCSMIARRMDWIWVRGKRVRD